jgi:hypothetical protein
MQTDCDIGNGVPCCVELPVRTAAQLAGRINLKFELSARRLVEFLAPCLHRLVEGVVRRKKVRNFQFGCLRLGRGCREAAKAAEMAQVANLRSIVMIPPIFSM